MFHINVVIMNSDRYVLVLQTINMKIVCLLYCSYGDFTNNNFIIL